MANRAACASGGSGACYKGLVRLTEGNYGITVGSGGYGWSRDINQSPPASQNGGNTTFSKDGIVILNVGGGTAASSWQSGATAGIGGTVIQNDLDIITTDINLSGNNGNQSSGSSSRNVSGASGVYSGHTYGASGGAGGSPGGGSSSPSYHGFFQLTYKYSDDYYNLYKGNEKIRYVYYEGYEIKKIYKGDTLIFYRVKYNPEAILLQKIIL